MYGDNRPPLSREEQIILLGVLVDMLIVIILVAYFFIPEKVRVVH